MITRRIVTRQWELEVDRNAPLDTAAAIASLEPHVRSTPPLAKVIAALREQPLMTHDELCAVICACLTVEQMVAMAQIAFAEFKAVQPPLSESYESAH